MKKVLIALGALIVVVIVAALVAPFLIPTDTYKTRLISVVKNATGRDLKIDGPVKLSFLPTLAVEASDVAFANAPGAHDPDMMRLKSLEVRLQVLPLLHGAVEIGSFVLQSPIIALEIDKSGRPNWVFAPATPAPASAPAAAAPAAAPSASAANPASALSELRLDDVRLVDGSVSYRDDRTNTAEQLDAINMKVSLPGLDSPFTATGSPCGTARRSTLTVGSTSRARCIAGKPSGLAIKLAAPAGQFRVSPAMRPACRRRGSAARSISPCRRCAAWPNGWVAAARRRARLRSSPSRAGSTWRARRSLSPMPRSPSTQSRRKGRSRSIPAARGLLSAAISQVDKLDVNPYLPPEAAPGATTPAASGAAPAQGGDAGCRRRGWSDAPIDVSPLSLVDADFDLSAGAISIARSRSARARSTSISRAASSPPTSAGCRSIRARERARSRSTAAVPCRRSAMNFDLSGVADRAAVRRRRGQDRVQRHRQGRFDVNGRGKSQRALISALAGKGALDLANGQIKGVNLIALGDQPRLAADRLEERHQHQFRLAHRDLHDRARHRQQRRPEAQSGPVPVTGKGTVDLPDRTVDYHLTVSPAGAVGVPILVTGPWDDISYRPDLGAALKGAAQAPGAVLNQLRGVGGAGASAGSSAVDKLKGLFGK